MKVSLRHSTPPSQTLYKLLSLLLQYPDERLIDARPALLAAARALPAAPQQAAIARFCAYWAAATPVQLAQTYVETFFTGVLGGGYNYRVTVGVWFRGLFLLHPHPELMATAPLLYQAHAASAWLLVALWPFSRLVHAWSVPVQYLGRPYILYRRRFAR